MKAQYKDILIFQIIAWIIAFNFFAVIRYLTTPVVLEIPLLKAGISIFDFFLIHTILGILMGFLLSLEKVRKDPTISEIPQFITSWFYTISLIENITIRLSFELYSLLKPVSEGCIRTYN